MEKMDKNDKRDLMASVLLQGLFSEKLKWLGEHSRKQNTDRLEGLLDDAVRDYVAGVYVLVDEMLLQSTTPNYIKEKPTDSRPTVSSSKAPIEKIETAKVRPLDASDGEGDIEGAKSDLSPIS
jgi:hypothetical protein